MPDHPMTDQVSLIEGLAHSNKEKIGAFENLKLGTHMPSLLLGLVLLTLAYLGTDINLFALQNNSEEEAKESALTEYDDDPQESGFRDNPRPIQLRHCLMMFTAMLNENDKVKYYMMPSSRSRVREGLHDMFNNEMDVLGKVVGNPLQEPIRAYFAALVTASKYKFSSKTPMELARQANSSRSLPKSRTDKNPVVVRILLLQQITHALAILIVFMPPRALKYSTASNRQALWSLRLLRWALINGRPL